MMRFPLIWLLALGLAGAVCGGETEDKLDGAEKLCQAGHITAAQELLKGMPAKDSLAAEALYARGLIRQYQGFEWDALFDYAEAAPKANGFLPAIKAFTRLAIDLDYLPNARKMAKIYQSHLPKDPDSYLALAEIDIRQHRFDSAQVWVDEAAKWTTDLTTIALWKAAIDVYSGRTEAGLSGMAGKAVTGASQFRHRAELFQYLNMTDSAIACLQAASRLDTADAGLKVLLGMSLVECRRLREAQGVVDRLLKDTEKYGPAWILAAHIKRAANRPLEAETLFYKYLELSESPIGLEKHGDFLMEFGDVRTASIDYQNAYIMASNLQYPDDYIRIIYRKAMNACAENMDAPTLKELVTDADALAGDPDYDFYRAETMRLFPDAADSARILIDDKLAGKLQDEVWLNWAAPYFLHGRSFDKAALCYEHLLRFPYPLESSVVGLIQAYQEGRKPRSADSLAAALPFRFQNSRRVNEAFLALYRTAGENAQAAVFAEKLYRMAPGFLPYDTALASLYAAQEKTEAARAILAGYVKSYPDDATGYYILAQFDQAHGAPASVEENIVNCLERDSTFAEAYELRGLCLQAGKQNEAALASFRKAIALQCRSPWAYYYVAEDMLNRNDSLLRAAGLGMTAVSYFSNDRRGLELLGRIYLAMKNYDVAKTQFAQGLMQFHNDPRFQFYLGKTYLLMENQAEAKKQLETALADGLTSPFREEARKLLDGLKP
jgi:predicted Zn-dependent protease